MKFELGNGYQHLMRCESAGEKANHYPGCAFGIATREGLISSNSGGHGNIESELKATTQSLFRIASMTKSFVSMAILQLRDQGLLRLDEAAETIIPELCDLAYPGADCPHISIENLLTMTAGFPEDNRWADRKLDETEEQLLALINEGLSFSGPPNQAMEYSNLSYALLGLVITRVSGQSCQSYITDNIFKPLGMHNTVWDYRAVPSSQLVQGYRLLDAEAELDNRWQAEPLLGDGAWAPIGGIITSVEDFSLYMQFLLSALNIETSDNALEAEQSYPLKPSSVREMAQPRNPWAMVPGQPRDAELVSRHYGYGLEIRQDKRGLVSVGHAGALPGFGSYFHCYPELGFGVMLFTNLSYGPGMLEACDEVSETLIQKSGYEEKLAQKYFLLNQRRVELLGLLKGWDSRFDSAVVKELAEKRPTTESSTFLADNFYQDQSFEERIKQLVYSLDEIGTVKTIEPLVPINPLRGSFVVLGEQASLKVFFSLTPEALPRVQMFTIEKVLQ